MPESRDKETYQIIGAAMEVHRNLGAGFLEAVYGDALELEFRERGIPYEREKHIAINYKGQDIKSTYRADFVCYGTILVELKAVEELLPRHKAQIINYLRATGYKRGVLINFSDISLKFLRIVNGFVE